MNHRIKSSDDELGSNIWTGNLYLEHILKKWIKNARKYQKIIFLVVIINILIPFFIALQ